MPNLINISENVDVNLFNKVFYEDCLYINNMKEFYFINSSIIS